MGNKTLFIAAGHGGTDPGNTSAGVIERDELINIVAGMRTWVRQNQFPTGLGGIVFQDDALDLQGEINNLNAWQPSATDGDQCLDFHLDYKTDKPSGGALVLYDEAPYARDFALHFLTKWCAATGIANNGVFRSKDVAFTWRGWDDFGFCRPVWPGCIIELGCLTTPRDLQLVRDPEIQALACQLAIEAWKAIKV